MRSLTDGSELEDPLGPYRSVARQPKGDRPWVLANMVSGLDGSAAVNGRVGALSHPTDRHLFLLLRALVDVVLVGAATVRQERYGPVQLDERIQRERVEQGRSPRPRIGVVTRSLDVDLGGRLFTDADDEARPLVITCETSDQVRRAEVARVADVVVVGEETVDLQAALVGLRAQGAGVVLTEGGPALLGQLVHAGLLDELCLTLAPVMGGDPLPVSVSTTTSSLVGFRLCHVLTAESNLFLRYEQVGADV